MKNDERKERRDKGVFCESDKPHLLATSAVFLHNISEVKSLYQKKEDVWPRCTGRRKSLLA
jgi:hypothetical protein